MWKNVTSFSQLGHQSASRSFRRVPRQCPTAAAAAAAQQQALRNFRAVPSLRTSQEQKQQELSNDRNVLSPHRSETSKSGTDQEVAENPAAYDPSKTSPESEFEASEEDSKQSGKVSNPLDVSPANKDISNARDPMEGGPDRNADKPGPSSRGWTRKHREVHVPGGEKRNR